MYPSCIEVVISIAPRNFGSASWHCLQRSSFGNGTTAFSTCVSWTFSRISCGVPAARALVTLASGGRDRSVASFPWASKTFRSRTKPFAFASAASLSTSLLSPCIMYSAILCMKTAVRFRLFFNCRSIEYRYSSQSARLPKAAKPIHKEIAIIARILCMSLLFPILLPRMVSKDIRVISGNDVLNFNRIIHIFLLGAWPV